MATERFLECEELICLILLEDRLLAAKETVCEADERANEVSIPRLSYGNDWQRDETGKKQTSSDEVIKSKTSACVEK